MSFSDENIQNPCDYFEICNTLLAIVTLLFIEHWNMFFLSFCNFWCSWLSRHLASEISPSWFSHSHLWYLLYVLIFLTTKGCVPIGLSSRTSSLYIHILGDLVIPLSWWLWNLSPALPFVLSSRLVSITWYFYMNV